MGGPETTGAKKDASGPVTARSVMVVDDSGVFGFTLSLEFRRHGWDIFCCGSGEEAMKKLQERDFDLVLTDLHMPGMQGDVLAAKILDQRPAARIIVMSTSPKESIPPLPKGVVFLPKPVNVGKILEAFEKSHRAPGAAPGAAPPPAKPH